MSRDRAIVFDLDWTLYDADRFYLEAWSRIAGAVAARTGRDAGELADVLFHTWREFGPGEPQLFDRWLHAVGLPAEPWVDLARHVLHADWQPNVQPYASTRALLRDLSQRFWLGLLTEGRDTTQLRKLRGLGLQPLFDAVLVCGSKRSGEPYRQICVDLAIDPEATLAVGDRAETDLEPARLLGAATCLVQQGPFGTRSTPNAAADWCIPALDDLHDVVDAWIRAPLHRSVHVPPRSA